MKTQQLIAYFVRNIFIVVGLVLIWRGIWYVLDEIDIVFLVQVIFSPLSVVLF